MERDAVKRVNRLGFPWITQDPFLFCVYHADDYPKGNDEFGPDASLEGRNLGNDFIIKDGWRMYHGTRVPGFPVHPHRGFETVTVVRKGFVDHSDSLGGAGRYGLGDVQWMTAGKGIQHSEMFPLLNREEENPLELFQIWINLPKADKMAEAHYKMLWAEEIPVWEGSGTRVEMVAGNFDGLQPPAPAPRSWAANDEHQVAIWYMEMEPGAEIDLPVTSGDVNRSLYFFEGDSIRINHRDVDQHLALDLFSDLPATVKNGSALSRLLLLQGMPIGEPVASYGPFVMNSQSEIQQTYIDYQETRFGGWPWPAHDQVHGSQKRRFARHSDGREELPPSEV